MEQQKRAGTAAQRAPITQAAPRRSTSSTPQQRVQSSTGQQQLQPYRQTPSSAALMKPDAIASVQRQAEQYRATQKNLKQSIETRIEEGTAAERQQVEDAIKRYEQAFKKVLNDRQVKQLQYELEDNADALQELLGRVSAAYRQTVTAIKRDDRLTDEEKYEKISALQQQLEDALMSPEERQLKEVLEKQISSMLGMTGGISKMIVL